MRYCLVNPALCTQQYVTPRPKTGLQTRECGPSKINRASEILGALAVCDEHRVKVLEFVNILLGLTINTQTERQRQFSPFKYIDYLFDNFTILPLSNLKHLVIYCTKNAEMVKCIRNVRNYRRLYLDFIFLL